MADRRRSSASNRVPPLFPSKNGPEGPFYIADFLEKNLERAKGFEPSTPTLARSRLPFARPLSIARLKLEPEASPFPHGLGPWARGSDLESKDLRLGRASVFADQRDRDFMPAGIKLPEFKQCVAVAAVEGLGRKVIQSDFKRCASNVGT